MDMFYGLWQAAHCLKGEAQMPFYTRANLTGDMLEQLIAHDEM